MTRPETLTDFRSALRDWLQSNHDLAPRVDGELDESTVSRWRQWSVHLNAAGYAGITWPVEFGGRGLSAQHQGIWLEESARAEVPDHLGVIGLGMAGPTILSRGSVEQKERFLRPILDCSQIWCQGFSEPDSGSDLASVRTSAVDLGDHWLVNGQKVWSSFAHIAQWCLLLVRTDVTVASHQGLSYLLLDLSLDGVEVRPLRQITGDPEFNEIFLTDVRVPKNSILGAAGEGWKVAMTTLSHERGTHGVGLAARLDVELRAATTRLASTDADGRRPIDDPVVRGRLAVIWAQTQALRITNQRSLATLATTGSPGPEGTVAKLRWSELNQRLTELVVDAVGVAALQMGDDALGGGHWAYARLRARGNTIEAGTSEILHNIIAERVLGLPRSR